MQGSQPQAHPPFQGPLVGVRVIDLSTMYSGPFAASLLADFGADVIKVELPKVGDSNRGIGPVVKGVPGPWTSIARNKRSISLDIRKDKGKEILKRLVAGTDVVIENFRPGTMERWDLGYDVLKEVNPKLIMIRISGYGQTGPDAEKAGFGTPATAFSGLTYMQGYPDRPPVSPPFPLADYVTGTFGALAAVMALYHLKAHEGAEGQVADLALFETVFRMLEAPVAQYDLTGKVKERVGHTNLESAPAGAFQCQDGHWVVMVTSTDRTWHRLAEVIGRADLLKDPRYDTNYKRSDHKEEINGIVQDWFFQHPKKEALEILDQNGVPVCSINSMADIFENPQYRARQDLIEVAHPILGKVTMAGIIPKFSATPGAVRFPGPATIGEHNEEIYLQELGLSPDEFESLKAEEVI